MWFLAINHLSASMKSKFYEKRSLVIFCGQKNPPFKLIGMLGVIWIEFVLFSEITIWKPILNSQVPNTLSCPNCMFLLKKLPPEKKMTSCHPALFESEKSCRWMWKGKENRESGKPGFVLEQKSSNWKISGNGCEHMWKSHRKWRYLSNCIKMFLITATIGRNEESEVAVIWPNWPILTPNILDSKC